MRDVSTGAILSIEEIMALLALIAKAECLGVIDATEAEGFRYCLGQSEGGM